MATRFRFNKFVDDSCIDGGAVADVEAVELAVAFAVLWAPPVVCSCLVHGVVELVIERPLSVGGARFAESAEDDAGVTVLVADGGFPSARGFDVGGLGKD